VTVLNLLPRPTRRSGAVRRRVAELRSKFVTIADGSGCVFPIRRLEVMPIP
jgi:hypothetical protein